MLHVLRLVYNIIRKWKMQGKKSKILQNFEKMIKIAADQYIMKDRQVPANLLYGWVRTGTECRGNP